MRASRIPHTGHVTVKRLAKPKSTKSSNIHHLTVHNSQVNDNPLTASSLGRLNLNRLESGLNFSTLCNRSDTKAGPNPKVFRTGLVSLVLELMFNSDFLLLLVLVE